MKNTESIGRPASVVLCARVEDATEQTHTNAVVSQNRIALTKTITAARPRTRDARDETGANRHTFAAQRARCARARRNRQWLRAWADAEMLRRSGGVRDGDRR